MPVTGQQNRPAATSPCVIFDVDGVLVESPHEQAWQEALAHLMREQWRDLAGSTEYVPEGFTTVVYQRYVAGKPRESGARAVLEYFGVPDAERRSSDYAALKQRRIEELIAAGSFTPFADALRLVCALNQRRLRLAAASSSKNANTMMALVDLAPALGIKADGGCTGDKRTLLDVFDINVCGRDVAHGKPSPDLFLLAAQEMGVDPENCVVVEDAPAGVRAAKSGGMRAIGIARLDDAAMLQEADADLVVETLDDVDIDGLVAGRLESAQGKKKSYREEPLWSRT
jgi:beta-phosphoglucomutase